MKITEMKDRLRIAKSAWLTAYNYGNGRVPNKWEEHFKEEFQKYDGSGTGSHELCGYTGDHVMRFVIIPLIDKLIKFNCL